MQASKAGRPKSKEKREAILKAAEKLFLDNGLKQTSMEGVAKLSGVSKQTIYSHYSNKDALFSAVIARKCKEYMIENEHLADNEKCLRTALTHIATKFLALFHDPAFISIYSTIIAEARNAPRVAELFYDAGPLASKIALADVMFDLSDGRLSKGDASKLSIDFFNFLKGELHTRSLMNLDFSLNEDQRKVYVKCVVDKTMCLFAHHFT